MLDESLQLPELVFFFYQIFIIQILFVQNYQKHKCLKL
jgi:hypothetical protein